MVIFRMTGGTILSIQTCISISSSGRFIIFKVVGPSVGTHVELYQLSASDISQLLLYANHPEISAEQLQSNQQTMETILRAVGRTTPLVPTDWNCRNVSRFERPDSAYDGTIEYDQHYMQIVWRMSWRI